MYSLFGGVNLQGMHTMLMHVAGSAVGVQSSVRLCTCTSVCRVYLVDCLVGACSRTALPAVLHTTACRKPEWTPHVVTHLLSQQALLHVSSCGQQCSAVLLGGSGSHPAVCEGREGGGLSHQHDTQLVSGWQRVGGLVGSVSGCLASVLGCLARVRLWS